MGSSSSHSSLPAGQIVGFIGALDGGPSLVSVGASRIVHGSKPEDLTNLLADLSSGDVLAVPSLDHLHVSMWRIFDMIDDMQSRSVDFVSVKEGVDTRDEKALEALAIMRSILAAEKRLVARRVAEAKNGTAMFHRVASCDRGLERSRQVMAPWIGDVLEHRPHMTWDGLVDLVSRQGVRDAPTPSLMRRHVRRLVEAGDIPSRVMDRTQRQQDGSVASAGIRARKLAASEPNLSLRDIGVRLEAEGLLPPRAGSWSAQTVKRLLASDDAG